jgi:hypothetical protein
MEKQICFLRIDVSALTSGGKTMQFSIYKGGYSLFRAQQSYT